MKEKVILMDYGYYVHSAGWCAVNNPGLPASYTCLNMMISDLRKIGLEPEDIIIVGVDYHKRDDETYSSWRKQFVGEYKGGRMKLPMEIYQELNELTEKIKISTDWNIVECKHLEYDDIAAVACRYYQDKNKEVVIISADCDLEQMFVYDHVKVFSPHKKSKCYKIKPDNFDIYKLLSKKIKKEAKDQVTSEILNADDYDNRRLIMDLTTLPDWVENLVYEELGKLKYSPPDIQAFPFYNLKEKYLTLYDDKSKVITYEQSVKKKLRKENIKKNKLKQKREEKKNANKS